MASPYAQGGSAGGSVYAETGTTGGSPYAGSSSGKAAPKKSGGGILGGILHTVEKTGSDLAHAAINAPAGAYQVGKAVALDERDALLHPSRHPDRTLNLATGTAKQVGTDLRHPLRHPGYTLLDVLPFANTAAKVGEAGALAREGEVGAAAKSLVTRSKPGERVHQIGGLKAEGDYSRAPFTRVVQKASDKVLKAGHDRNQTGRLGQAFERRVSKALTLNTRYETEAARGPAAALKQVGARLKPEEQMALRVVAKETPLEGKIAAHRLRLHADISRAERGRHEARIAALEKARPLLAEENGVPKLASPKLQHIYDKMSAVATDREDLLKKIDALTPEGIQTHKTEALRANLGLPLHEATHTPEIPGQLEFPSEAKSTLPVASADAVHVPERATFRGSKSLDRMPGLGGQGTIGHARKPTSLTAGYEGKAVKHGLERQDTTALVAEANLEAQKYSAALHLRDVVKGAGHKVPQAKDDVFVRLDNLKSSEATPLPVRRFLENPQEQFVHPDERAGHYADFLKQVFVPRKTMTPGDAATFEKLANDGKGVWVSKTILGDFAKSHAPLRSVLGGKPTSTIDAINNASRFAILYLKPAYAAPNLLGNVSLNLIQQGPIGFARTLRDVSALSFKRPDLAARVDALMGEGVAQSVAGDAGVGHRVVQGAANVWSRGVDTPFRRSAFLYEARRAGFTGPDGVGRLLTDETQHSKLLSVTRRANREIIDYGRLGPREREIVRRVVFFYPWVKGSTMYAGHLVAEHPFKAAGIGQTGRIGRAEAQKELGPVPSYLEGAFPVGGRLVNPTSAAILQTPAQVGLALAHLLGGNTDDVSQLTNFLTPAATLAIAEATRTNPGIGKPYPGNIGGLGIARDVLGNGLPQAVLYQRIHDAEHGKGQTKLYPPNVRDALLQYLIGGIAPRKYNPQELNALANREQTRVKTGR